MSELNQRARWRPSPKVLISLIILLAGVIRLSGLSSLPNGLHWDELDTGYQAFSLLTTGRDYFGNILPVFPHSFADFRTPIYIYSSIPQVYLFGLSAFSVRIGSVVFGLFSIALFYTLVTRLFSKPQIGLLAALGLAVSVWHIQYSRQSVETISLLTYLLLGLNFLLKSLKTPKSLIPASMTLSMATLAYSPGKMFVPLLALFFAILNRKSILKFNSKIQLYSGIICFVIFGFVIFDSIFGKSGTRFHDLSIFTDPTIASEINFKRAEAGLSVTKNPDAIGVSPRLVDKVSYNKPVYIFQKFVINYLNTFSFDFLFIKGDAEARHSPARNEIGQLMAIEAIPFVIGLYILVSKKQYFLLMWLLLAPIPSALTRDGGTHSARLLILLPALQLTIAVGVYQIFRKTKLLFLIYSLFFIFSVVYTLNYYFSTYRFESAKPFQWGFGEMVKRAVSESPNYDTVILDAGQDSALMAYLFTTKYSPAKFQSLQQSFSYNLVDDVTGKRFGNILLLSPGSRTWTDLFSNNGITGHNLIIASAGLSQLESVGPSELVRYPNRLPAFYIFSHTW